MSQLLEAPRVRLWIFPFDIPPGNSPPDFVNRTLAISKFVLISCFSYYTKEDTCRWGSWRNSQRHRGLVERCKPTRVQKALGHLVPTMPVYGSSAWRLCVPRILCNSRHHDPHPELC